ncbi:MAG: hypothetical protein ACK49D_07195 [Flavobacteriia bacterium]|jgi:hypothetical protein|nr:hypothetical protein [Cryomorphaceae bacterium]
MKRQLVITLGILLVALTFSSNSFSQVVKLRSTTMLFRLPTEDNDWTDWSEPEEASVLITWDTSKNRITIYSATTQEYDIADYQGKETDDDGDDFLSFYCVDGEGETCLVKLATLNSQNGRKQVYVFCDNKILLYNAYVLD